MLLAAFVFARLVYKAVNAEEEDVYAADFVYLSILLQAVVGFSAM